jgi:PAS domain S-box-containing protein
MSIIGDVPWGTHFCHFYETKQDLLDTLVPYFKAGLESKEFCLWVVSNSELITVEEAKEALEQAVPDLDRHLSDEDIEILDGPDWYLKEDVFNLERVMSAWDAKLNRALALGYDGMRISGDTFWLGEKDWKDFCVYEKQLDDSLTDRPVTALCTYPLAKSGAAQILDVVQTHQFAIARRQGKWEVVETTELVQAKAEIKRLNEELEQRVVERTRELAATNEELSHEIIERNRAEDALRDSRRYLQALFDNSLDAILVTNDEGRYIDANPAACALLGYTHEELMQLTILDITAEPFRQERWAIWQQFLARGSWSGEHSALRKDRAVRLLEFRAVANILPGVHVASCRDITERKRAEEARREAEQKYRDIFENALEGIFQTSPDGRFVVANPALAHMFGFASAEELIRERADISKQHYVEPKRRDEFKRLLEEEDIVHHFEYEAYRKDGSRIWVSDNVRAVRDQNGRVLCYEGTAKDITERKQAEEQLKQSERQLAEAQHLASIGSWDWDLISKALNWSDELYRIFGVDSQTFNPAYEDVVMEFIHAEDRALVRGVVESSLKNQEPYSFYYRILRTDGEERVIYSRGEIVSDEHGNPIRMFGTAQDVTERKQAEEQLKKSEQQLAEAQRIAHVGHWERDLQTGLITWSDEIYCILGLPSQERALPRTEWRDMLHPEDWERVSLAIEEAQLGVRRYDVEYRIVRPDGEVRFIHSQGDIIRDEQGQPRRAFGIMQDITERKQAEEQLRATTEQLRALSARIHSAKEEEGTRIAREIHDELGAALTSLRWDLESVDKVISESGDQPQLKVLRERIESMLRLTETTISSVRRISSELRPSILDDLGLVEAIEWQAQQFQDRMGIICRCDCSLENLDLSREQSTAVFRILQEALTNILRHAQATRVDITTKVEAGEFVLAIIDNGRGITENKKSGAQSLGLLGMQERAHLIGGKINITGVEGKGTMITVRVPISG